MPASWCTCHILKNYQVLDAILLFKILTGNTNREIETIQVSKNIDNIYL